MIRIIIEINYITEASSEVISEDRFCPTKSNSEAN